MHLNISAALNSQDRLNKSKKKSKAYPHVQIWHIQSNFAAFLLVTMIYLVAYELILFLYT